MMPSARVPPWRDVRGKDWRRCHFPAERQGLIEALALLDSPENGESRIPCRKAGASFPRRPDHQAGPARRRGAPRVDLHGEGV